MTQGNDRQSPVTSVIPARRNFVAALCGGAVRAVVGSALIPMIVRSAVVQAEGAVRQVAPFERIAIPGVQGLYGMLVRPANQAGARCILVAGSRGLDGHALNVARALAREGFIALAVDYLGPEGGTPSDRGKALELLRNISLVESLERSAAAIGVLKQGSGGSQKVGAVGFGWGGGAVNAASVVNHDLLAVVSYYGAPAHAYMTGEYKEMTAHLLLHYAGRDHALNVGIGMIVDMLENEHQAASSSLEVIVQMFPGVNRGFAEATDVANYDRAVADLAWSRSLSFLKKHLVDGSLSPTAP